MKIVMAPNANTAAAAVYSVKDVKCQNTQKCDASLDCPEKEKWAARNYD